MRIRMEGAPHRYHEDHIAGKESKNEVIAEARNEVRKVHFASLMNL